MGDEVAAGGLFTVNFARVREALAILADDVEFIANGEADGEPPAGDAWDRRCRAGKQINRLLVLLNGGSLDLADCDIETIKYLESAWAEIGSLGQGAHYAGPLFLPHELDVHEASGLKVRLRTADESFDSREDKQNIPASVVELLESARTQLWVDGGMKGPAPEPCKPLEWTTTKRQMWGEFPGVLRRLVSKLPIESAESRIVDQYHVLAIASGNAFYGDSHHAAANQSAGGNAHNAHNEILFPKGPLSDPLLTEAIVALQAGRLAGKDDNQILRQLTRELSGDCPQVRKYQSRIRGARSQGLTTLPPSPRCAQRAQP